MTPNRFHKGPAARAMWLTLVALLLVFQVTTHALADTPQTGGTLVVGVSSDPPVIDTLHTNLLVTRITAQICENLVSEDPLSQGQTFSGLVPGLAESWEVSNDGLEYTFFLRQGVSFTDGTPFNAEAVVANFDRILNPESSLYADAAQGRGTAAGLLATVDSYEAVDEHTFRATLSEPYASFLLDLRHRLLGIVSPTALAEHSNDMHGAVLSCTGPFIFQEHDRGTSVTLRANEDYWNRAERGPYVDRVIFRVMPDASSRVAALMVGEIDVDTEIPADRVPELDANPEIEVVMAGAHHIWFWGINHRSETMQDLAVRQAILHALDVEGMVNTLYGDTALPLSSFLPPGNPGYRPDYQRPYPYDPERARQILAEAGYENGVDVALHLPLGGGSYMNSVAMAQWTQANLREVGIRAEIETYEVAAWLSLIVQGAPDHIDLFAAGWQSIAYDPRMMESLFATHTQRPHGINDHWYSNPEFDELVVQARRTIDEDARLALYHQAEDVLLQDVGVIPVAHDRQPRAHRVEVRGVGFIPSPWFDLTSVWFDR